MAQITVDTSGLDVTARRINLLTEQQLTTAIALALRDGAAAGRDHLKAELAKPSGGPIEGGATRWTIGGTYASRFVQPQALEAEVGFASTQPHAAGRYLTPLLTGTRARTKGLDLKLADRYGLVFSPLPVLGRTPQGNISRAGLRLLYGPSVHVTPLRGGVAYGVWDRLSSRVGRTDTYENRRRLLGVLKPPSSRRRTLDLRALVEPTVSREFALAVERRLAASLARVGLA